MRVEIAPTSGVIRHVTERINVDTNFLNGIPNPGKNGVSFALPASAWPGLHLVQVRVAPKPDYFLDSLSFVKLVGLTLTLVDDLDRFVIQDMPLARLAYQTVKGPGIRPITFEPFRCNTLRSYITTIVGTVGPIPLEFIYLKG